MKKQYKIIPSAHYAINSDLEIINLNTNIGDDIIYLKNNMVNITLYGIRVTVPTQWLYYIARFKVDLPKKLHKRLMDINFTEIQYMPTFSKTRVTMYFTKPIYYDNNYRLVPNYINLAVDPYGNVIKITTGNPKRVHISKNIYCNISTFDYDKERNTSSVNVHRLVALAWVPNDNYYKRFHVNHIDGNKHNNYYKNLEWVTAQENVVHAKQNNLRKDHIGIKTRNAETKEIIEHKSLNDACAHMGISPRSIQNLLSMKESRLISNKYEVKRTEDTTPWFYENKVINDNTYIGNWKYLVTLSDGTIETVYGKNNLGVKYNIPYAVSTLSTYNKEKIIDLVKAKNKDIINIEAMPLRNETCVEAKNIKTGEVYKANAANALGEIIGINRRPISRYIKKGIINKTYDNTWLFRKCTESSWVTDYEYDKTSVVLNCGKKQKVFKSMRAVARYLNVNLSVVQRVVRDKAKYDNCSIYLIN